MMKLPERKFETTPPGVMKRALIVGITGESGSGKTYSALRLATGMQTVLKGKTFGIDTEGGRMQHYKKYFKFEHKGFAPPHGPLDYQAIVEQVVKEGAKVIVIDSMSHEHSGEGGVLDQIEAYLEAKCGDDWEKRERIGQGAHVRPKAQRKQLNRRIIQLADVVFILCYRGSQKIKPRKKAGPDGKKGMEDLGFQPDTTSNLRFDMAARFLLMPGAEGKPTLVPDNEAEKLLVKNPEQFKSWFKTGFQLDEALGAKLATWHLGVDEGEEAPKPLPQGVAAIQATDSVKHGLAGLPDVSPAGKAKLDAAIGRLTGAANGKPSTGAEWEKHVRASKSLTELKARFAEFVAEKAKHSEGVIQDVTSAKDELKAQFLEEAQAGEVEG